MKFRIGVLFIVLMLGRGFSQPAAVDSLQLPRALQLLEENNLDLARQQKMIQQALTEAEIQNRNFLPLFSLSGSYRYVSEVPELQLPFSIPGQGPVQIEAGVPNQYEVNAALQQPVFSGFRLSALRQSVKISAESVRQQRRVVRAQLRLQTHELFYEIQLSRLQQRALESSINRMKTLLAVQRAFLEAQQATPFDTLQTANQMLGIRTRQVQSRHRQEILLSRLALILRLPEIASVSLKNVQSPDLLLQPLAEYQSLARNQRPELAVIRRKMDVQQFQKKIAKSAFYPQVNAQAAYHYGRPGVNFFRDDWMAYYTVGLNLNWEVWNWGGTRKRLRQADYQMESLHLEEQQLLYSIDQQVKQAWETLLSSREQIELSRRLAAQAAERYRLVEDQYREGILSASDLSEAESDLTIAELQLQQHYIDWLKNKAGLQWATGEILAQD
ncbi:MAG: TolC family protein [Calditrichia bacterium]